MSIYNFSIILISSLIKSLIYSFHSLDKVNVFLLFRNTISDIEKQVGNIAYHLDIFKIKMFIYTLNHPLLLQFYYIR